jgi:hypothetical protein
LKESGNKTRLEVSHCLSANQLGTKFITEKENVNKSISLWMIQAKFFKILFRKKIIREEEEIIKINK